MSVYRSFLVLKGTDKREGVFHGICTNSSKTLFITDCVAKRLKWNYLSRVYVSNNYFVMINNCPMFFLFFF